MMNDRGRLTAAPTQPVHSLAPVPAYAEADASLRHLEALTSLVANALVGLW